MKKTVFIVAIVLIAAIFAVSAYAVPCKPGLRTITQPDGNTFIGRFIGDEHYSFVETAEGFSVQRNNTGWWTYASQENGLLVPTTYVAGRDACPFTVHMRPNAEAVAALPENANKEINRTAADRIATAMEFFYGKGGTAQHPTKSAPNGRQYVSIVLGDLTDSTFAFYAASQRNHQNNYAPFPCGASAAADSAALVGHINFLANGDSIAPIVMDSTIVGSFTNFYWEMTYNKAWWYAQVQYGKSTGYTKSGALGNVTGYMQAAVTAADPFINFALGGSANCLIVIHPGAGYEETGNTADLHSASYQSGLGITTNDGVTLNKGCFIPQNAQLGVMCHEMFHQACGGPDLYDYGYSANPWGQWSLMDYGSWNGITWGGDSPSFIGGFLAYHCTGVLTDGTLGWLTNTDSISSAHLGDGRYTIAALDSAGEKRRGNLTNGIRLWRIRNNNFRDSSQIFFVELRRRTAPYEQALPGDGLIISHCDTRMAGTGASTATMFNNGPPNKRAYCTWVERSGVDPNPLYAIGDTLYPGMPDAANYSADIVAPGGQLRNRIDSTSVPNSLINKCYATTTGKTGPWITDISRNGPTMTFNVLRVLASASPLISYQTATVLDPVAGGGANNNNGLLDPWETDSIKLTFLNSGANITAGAQCSLYVVGGSQWVSIPTPGWQSVGGGLINKDANAVSTPFVVTVDKNAPRFTDILFAVKFKSTTPAVTDTSNFSLRISPFQVVKTYDFSNLQVGGATYAYRISPSDLAIFADTLWVANANLDNAVVQTRVYRVKKSTTNNPLVGGVGGDTLGSQNNAGSVHCTGRYAGGMDIDNSGNLWISLADSVYRTDRHATTPQQFLAPNVSWGGTPMKRIRGLAFGPSVVDTVGGSPNMPGDSLWAYYQVYPNAGGAGVESLYVLNRGASAMTVAYRKGFADSAWGASQYGYGYEWWNGRALEYDGANIWTTSVASNVIIKRRASDARVTMVMPGPSEFGSYGTYGLAYEATDAAGVPYAPVGTVPYAPYKRGNIHYLYCAAMDEAKIYKILATDFFVPTPCDSVKARIVDATHDWVVWYKHNADTQKVFGYTVYGTTTGGTPNFATDSMNFKNSTRVGSAVSPKDSIQITHAKGKATYYYSVMPINYGGNAGWGASVPANPLAVEFQEFSCALGGDNTVTLNWITASETEVYQWVIERSPTGVEGSYVQVGGLPGHGTTPMASRYSFSDQLPGPGMYYYRIGEITSSQQGHPVYYGPLVVTSGVPSIYELGQNFPNPVGPGATAIKYALKSPGQTSLRIYNVLGEEVRNLVDKHQTANYYTTHWDGKDNAGKGVSNGVYFYKLTSGDFKSTKKMMVLR